MALLEHIMAFEFGDSITMDYGQGKRSWLRRFMSLDRRLALRESLTSLADILRLEYSSSLLPHGSSFDSPSLLSLTLTSMGGTCLETASIPCG